MAVQYDSLIDPVIIMVTLPLALIGSYINNLRKEKQYAVYDAVIESASLRVRPILMTSITTIIGLSPLIFGWSEGLEMLRPLAITVVGGLSVSMLLTLFVIPCVYSVFHKARP
ncbi:MAG: efflux RND transporter permease subunit [Deltaproteobacteria bacterium]|jgi:multidrug efflux pump subunit AcrB|nr:efflux RND transporter permease subunit [Deltaproteobacteria bacterium]